jgi:Icc-related predicted phosphoesterase
MELALVSDIHLEFGDIDITNTKSADVLILSGDICTARDLVKQNSHHERTVQFWHTVNEQYDQTVFVMGNHEHYGSDYRKTQKIFEDFFAVNGLTNIHLLEKSSVEIDNILFIGGTLWTDFDSGNPLTKQWAGMYMNDYRAIKDSRKPNYKLYPEEIWMDHIACKNYILDTLETNKSKPTVVVGHHAPSRMSIAEQYRGDQNNGLYCSSLEDIMLDNPQILLWTHGHTHDPFDYIIGETRVVCNPRGYAGEEQRAHEWKMEHITV